MPGDFERFKLSCDLSEETCGRLVRVYGVRAETVVRLAAEAENLREVVCDETGSIAAQVVFAFRNELAETLQDCLLRRTMVGLNSRLGLNAVEKAAEICQKYLGWDDARSAREIDEYRKFVQRFLPRST